MGELSKLKGIGPKSEKCLNDIGIYTKEDLLAIGAVNAFLKLNRECQTKPSLNFLYALVGATENRNWIDIAKTERARLLMQLEGYEELEKILLSEGVNYGE